MGVCGEKKESSLHLRSHSRKKSLKFGAPPFPAVRLCGHTQVSRFIEGGPNICFCGSTFLRSVSFGHFPVSEHRSLPGSCHCRWASFCARHALFTRPSVNGHLSRFQCMACNHRAARASAHTPRQVPASQRPQNGTPESRFDDVTHGL